MKVKLKAAEHNCLCEALRRYTRFHADKPLTDAWTGLGGIATYRAALHGGYMRRLFPSNEPHDEWWALTEKGSEIVAHWIAEGYSFEHVEHGHFVNDRYGKEWKLLSDKLPPKEVDLTPIQKPAYLSEPTFPISAKE